MEIMNILHIFSFLALAAMVASHAALTPKEYWNSVLPNTPMPKAASDLLQLDGLMDEKPFGITYTTPSGPPSGPPGSGIGVGVGQQKTAFNYFYGASEDQVHDDPNVALFFLERDMHPGKRMNLHFMTQNSKTGAATFLPRQVAKSIPFSSNRLPEILNKFSFKPGSPEADVIKNTIEECEKPAIKGEEKYCATSLESMVDFSTSKLGKDHVRAISTEVAGKETQMQKYYTIMPGVKKMAGNKAVVCHKQNYAYAVFFCHATRSTSAYLVPLVGNDGTKAKAVAICHTDTSAWNPKHLAFQVLKVKPGTVPVCHFLPMDHVVWTSN